MGAAAVNILRILFITIMQTAAFAAVSEFLERVIDYIRNSLKKDGNLTDSEVDDVISNDVIDILAFIGVTIVALRTRIPVRLADKLGLKVGKTKKVTLSPKTTAGAALAQSKGDLQPSLLTKSLKVIGISFLGSLPWLPGLIQQFGDQAAFAPKAANDFYENLFGKRPFTEANPLDSPGPFSPGEFADYARGLETAGIQGLEYAQGSFLYSREQLAKLVDYVNGVEAAKGSAPTVTKIKTLVAPYLLGITKTTKAATATSGNNVTSAATTTPKVQVFTGVLSQGVLGKGLEFQARPDDLIETADELVQAASNNLAPFLSSLFGRVSYQVRVVNSVTTKDGFTQKGSVVQVVSGYNTNGTPKYRTVVNKFAVLDIYILNDKQVRTKLTTITLGPVDSVKFQVQPGTLSYIDSTLQGQVTTTSIEAIKGVETISPVTITTPQNQVIQQPTNQAQLTPTANPSPYEEFDTVYAYRNNLRVVFNSHYGRWGVRGGANAIFFNQKDQAYQYAGIETVPENPTVATPPPPSVGTVVAPTPPPISTPTPTPTVKPGANASNLSEWYAANNQSLPPLSARAILYESYGLGQSAFYAGTAEQNTKLLNKLKGL